MEGLLLQDSPSEGGEDGPHLKHVDVFGAASPVPSSYRPPLPKGSGQASSEPMISERLLRLGLNHDVLTF